MGLYLKELTKYNYLSNIWTIDVSHPSGKYMASPFSLNGFGYICNGFDGVLGLTNEVHQFVTNDNIPTLSVTLTIKE